MLDVQSACPALSAVVNEHEDALAVQFSVLLSLDARVDERSNDGAASLFCPGPPEPATGLRTIGNDELDVGMRPLCRNRELAPCPRSEYRAHEVQVLRHRLLLQ